ncbi:prephenate dehydrogenase [Oceanobacillus iheyensis]|uniref:Prephenate dehydrogenase n=1 Tax=Oceanobacillus iheyensis (strain DSM 14371 / CIP 107618 / JCM 11309 / KCTC 3954 / HTE831) TaxID=221109 RepID=Q8EQC0_OCEIH|nr:prephenate dehydrogenase [Oceanobacillus iheyensis]BAC13737.1 prephenate dehydrogenase [Oceanobacillus iheyensis HTE831]
MKQQTILIAGLGLIGGSIARAIRNFSDHKLIGFDVNEESLRYAKDTGIISYYDTNLQHIAKRADIIILAAPITETIKMIEELDEVDFPKQVIVTDTASVKGAILTAAQKINNSNITFIGGHPMAGSHKRGIEASKAHLFENAIYVLSPLEGVSSEQIDVVKSVLATTKCKFLVLKPEEHDEMTGVISHFPHLIASSLVHQAKKWEGTHAYLPNLAAGGFRDITRIASSNPQMWQDIFHHNQSKMSYFLEEWIQEMSHLKLLIETNEKNEILDYLDSAKKYRDGLSEKEQGAIPSFYDVYVDIHDQSGAIAKVVQILADENFSIKNIEILEVREGITGVLRLSFHTQKEQIGSSKKLTSLGYETMIQN